MSYKCDKCGKCTKNGERLTLEPVGYRTSEYTNIVLQKKASKGVSSKGAGKIRFLYSADKVEDYKALGWEVKQITQTKGQEVVGEQKVCPRCVNEENN